MFEGGFKALKVLCRFGPCFSDAVLWLYELKLAFFSTGPWEAPRGPRTRLHVGGSTGSFFSRGKIQHRRFLEPPGCKDVWCEEEREKKTTTTFICIVCLPILSPPFQVISLRDQIKRRQQGVDGGKDVREGFMHVGSSCFFFLYMYMLASVET